MICYSLHGEAISSSPGVHNDSWHAPTAWCECVSAGTESHYQSNASIMSFDTEGRQEPSNPTKAFASSLVQEMIGHDDG